ncbi:MAG TPA: RNB domain-containing ribonuclease, partial [Solirubrobacteraceae bacterium]|nr:RNB domain-containing ribonuclease [Solirubrobacteraceae bacterium]
VSAAQPERGGGGASGRGSVAVLEKRGRFFTATPFFARGRRINLKPPREVRAGDLVLVTPTGSRGGHGKVVRRLGRPETARDVLEALMLDRGLRRRFDPAVEREARAAAERPPGGEGAARRDLRDLPTFTIDPPSARDFDDAISAERLPDGATRVWVHIADVAAHVPPGSLVDREAHRRATSVYVPGLVEPMLPEALSNRACSLVPGQDRLAVTVELELEGAKVRRSAFARSVIRSDARLDYPQVDRIFAGQERAEAPWGAALEAARAVAAVLGEARAARGALAIESVEPEFDFSHEGHVTALVPTQQTESHRVIEHLMIAANEAVATLLEARRLPALYRVHERPEPARVAHLAEQLASLDVPTPPLPDPMSPQQAEDAIGEISRLVDAHVRRTGRGRAALTSLVLRSLKQAHYSPVNLGHAGLRSPRYCHFTSPIRRYPDLICHRALLAAVGAGEDPPTASSMGEAGDWCSQRERDAMAIERDADDVARCFLLEAELFRRGWHADWPGEAIGVIRAGAFVAFGDGYEGMLPVRRLRGDWWELNELETMLVGAQSGKAVRLGDPVTVRVERVDAPRGRVDLSPVELSD